MNREDISPKTIRSYLIGTLDEATTDALDELSIADQGLAERIAAEQYDLLDDWVAGRLDPTERSAFGLVLARSPTLNKKLKIAEVMAATPRVAVVGREPGFFASLFGGSLRPAYALGGLAILIGISVAAFLLVREDGVSELAEVSPTASVTVQPDASVSNQSPEVLEPAPSAPSKPTPEQNTALANRQKPSPAPTRRAAPIFATLVLSPPTRGASGVQSVTLQPGAEFLQLEIQSEAESSGRYIVEVGEPSGKADWTSQPIRGRSANGRRVITVQIPAARLKNGMRGVRLVDAAESEIVDEHIVEIKR